ncbi:MAG: enoyl-CoA hydratase/isomerase family protein [Bacteroidales bacterium]|nr:enoyl-CoA hydratase/isomerase family protein [Bacteroidales bacterium]
MKYPENKNFYEAWVQDEIAFIKIGKGAFELITDLNQSDKLIRFIDSLDQNNSVKCLIVFNDAESLSDLEYDRFIGGVLQKRDSAEGDLAPCFGDKRARFREINILNTLIRHLAGLQIIVFAGIQGTVVTPFFGASLVADFRIAAENAVFSLAHNKYGLHPSGGLPFFLSNMLHHSKALEVQLRDRIDANEAYELGLVNLIVPDDKFEERLIGEAKKYSALSFCTIRDTKRLTNFSRKSINKYFEFEAGLLNL